jgi:ribosome-associated heat shock protein Hsp15
MANGVRVDVWLWAVRVYRSRTASTTACGSGSVRVNGVVAKPSKTIAPGDRVTTRVAHRQRDLEVVETPTKRLGAALAADALIDHSPPPEPRLPVAAKPAVREPGSGRPTKRDRRQIDRLRGRDD